MNILFISALPLWSGKENKVGGPAFSQTIQAYLNAGHQVFLITSEDANKSLSADKFQVYVIPLEKLMISKRYFFRESAYIFLFPLIAFWFYLRFVKLHKIDLIYGYEITGILSGWIIGIIARARLVSRFQGTILAPVVLQKSSLYKKLIYIQHFLAFKVPADLAIMTNDGTFGDQVMQRLNPALAQRMVFWRNGSDPLIIQPDTIDLRKRYGLNKDALILLTVSRLVNWKRVDRAILALPIILKSAPDVCLVVVGDGPETDHLRQLSIRAGVNERVFFTGYIPNDDVHAYYQQADIFLSLYDLSNLGNPLFEAMRGGKPIITIGNGETASIIHHGINGLLLKTGEPCEVAEAVIYLMANGDKRTQLGEAAFEYARTNFYSWQERMEKEINLVENFIQEGKPR